LQKQGKEMFKPEKLKITRSRMENQMMDDDDILTESEAAKFLKVSSMTLSRWRNAGAIGFYRPGGYRVTYSKNHHIMPFLQACEISAKAA
jgi:excisionase family DNA binding protein